MGRWYAWDPEVRVNPTSFFTNHWDTRDVTFARPAAYALNTLAKDTLYIVPTRLQFGKGRKDVRTYRKASDDDEEDVGTVRSRN